MDPTETLRDSARQWHTFQLAALGFVGLCGVIKGDAGADLPHWLQTASGVLALLALAVAGASILVVATVAWPLVVATLSPEVAARRLRRGVGLTFVAVALTALSAASSWWPRDGSSTSSGDPCAVVVVDASGVRCAQPGGSGG